MISIVLPTYNRLEISKKVILPSLELQDHTDYEVILVDDGSEDGTDLFFEGDEVKKLFPRCSSRLIYHRNPKNLGLPASRNVGVLLSKGDWLFMVEDDLELIGSDFLSRSADIIKRLGKDFAIISPMRVEQSTGYYNGCFDGYIRVGAISGEIYVNSLASGVEHNIPCTHACSFIRRGVFDACQYKATRGLSFREETGFYFCARKRGAKIVYLGEELRTRHLSNIAVAGGCRQIERTLLRKEIEYLRGHCDFLRGYYNFVLIRLLVFFLVRSAKHLANVFQIGSLKRSLARLHI